MKCKCWSGCCTRIVVIVHCYHMPGVFNQDIGSWQNKSIAGHCFATAPCIPIMLKSKKPPNIFLDKNGKCRRKEWGNLCVLKSHVWAKFPNTWYCLGKTVGFWIYFLTLNCVFLAVTPLVLWRSKTASSNLDTMLFSVFFLMFWSKHIEHSFTWITKIGKCTQN